MSGTGPGSPDGGDPCSYQQRRVWVEAMLECGQPFALVEQEIDDAQLGEEEQDALWLLAWSLHARQEPPPPTYARGGGKVGRLTVVG